MKKIKNIFFEITDICNEQCLHCDKQWRVDGGHTMDFKAISRILDIPKEHLTISGGEPGVVPDLVKYIIENEKSSVAINTNLTLWSKEMLAFFRKHEVYLSISVVSLNKKTYRKITGQSLVDKLKYNLSLVNANMSNIVIIVNKYNESEISAIVDYLAVRGFKKFTIQPSIPGFSGVFDRKVYTKHVNIVNNIIKTHQQLDISMMCFYDMTCPKIPINHICEAGKERLVVLSNGDIVPCACMAPIILGNILKDDFNVIIRNGMEYFNSFDIEEKYICKGFLENSAAKNYRINNITPDGFSQILVKDIYPSFHNVIESIALIKPYVKTVLDLGCGAGILHDLLPHNIQYTGVDINNKTTKNIINMDFLEELPNQYYDCIILNGAARFISSIKELMDLFSGILTKRPKQFIYLQKRAGIQRNIIIDSSKINFTDYVITPVNIKKIDKYINMPIRTTGFYLERSDMTY